MKPSFLDISSASCHWPWSRETGTLSHRYPRLGGSALVLPHLYLGAEQAPAIKSIVPGSRVASNGSAIAPFFVLTQI